MTEILFAIKSTIKKLRFVDYIIIVCICLFIGVFLFLRMSRHTEWVSVLVRVQGNNETWWSANSPPWFTKAATSNQISYDTFGQKTAILENIQSFDAGGLNEMYAELKLKVTTDPQRHQYIYNYQPLLVGKLADVSFGNLYLSGVVVGINTKLEYVNKHVEARIYAIHPWKIAELTKGLQAKDLSGNIVAEIEDISVQNNQIYRFNDEYGRQMIVPSEDPTRKDVIMKLKLKTIKYNNALYSIYGAPIKIGSPINIEFPNTSINYLEISAVYD
jgi:hypothetical protein